MKKKEFYYNWPTFIDLCCGAGGLTKGFKMRHWRPLLGIDNCQYSLETWKHNIRAPSILLDITCLEQREEIIRLFTNQNIDAVIGGPPCQGFSIAGKRDPDDPRNNILLDCARIAIKLNPKIIIFENVKMLEGKVHKTYLESTMATLRRAGYSAAYEVLDAQDFGVAQRRKRIFIFGSRISTRKKILNELKILTETTYPQITVSQAFDGLPLVRNNSSRIGPPNHEPMKHSLHVKNKIAGIPIGDGPFSYRKLDPDKPAGTLVCGNRAFPCHYKVPRTITVREAARIQSFPDSFAFYGPKSSQMKQVANAVPPKLAEAVAIRARNLLFD